jgi:hypothetical protein
VERSQPAAAPPLGQWKPLPDSGAGYLSFYYSEPLARYPIRHITRPADNKSDPNIETATYGLFSICERQMRGKIVREGRSHLSFVTAHRGPGRKLAGYYDLAWYAESSGGAAIGDYALAASKIKFVDPLPLNMLPGPLRRVCEPPFRNMRPVDAAATALLHDLLESLPDRTERYLAELARIEQFARDRCGFAYPSWGRVDGFTWDDADRYLGSSSVTTGVPAVPASHRWRCASCKCVITSRAFLKSCSLCGEMWTLKPVNE